MSAGSDQMSTEYIITDLMRDSLHSDRFFFSQPLE